MSKKKEKEKSIEERLWDIEVHRMFQESGRGLVSPYKPSLSNPSGWDEEPFSDPALSNPALVMLTGHYKELKEMENRPDFH